MNDDLTLNDPELGKINIEVGKTDTKELDTRIASVDPERVGDGLDITKQGMMAASPVEEPTTSEDEDGESE